MGFESYATTHVSIDLYKLSTRADTLESMAGEPSAILARLIRHYRARGDASQYDREDTNKQFALAKRELTRAKNANRALGKELDAKWRELDDLESADVKKTTSCGKRALNLLG